MKSISMITLIFVAVGAYAQEEWALRPTDRVLAADEVAELTVGRTLTFYDDGQSTYSAGGSYSYSYDGGATAFGQFRIEPDGTVCIEYRNGFSRCDRYVATGSNIVLLTQKGERFPVRPEPEK